MDVSNSDRQDRPLPKQGIFSRALSSISIGKYSTKLYHNGYDTQSSMCGGILTIICGLLITSYSGYILFNTWQGNTGRILSESITDVDNNFNFTMRDWGDAIEFFSIDVFRQTNCSTLRSELRYRLNEGGYTIIST